MVSLWSAHTHIQRGKWTGTTHIIFWVRIVHCTRCIEWTRTNRHNQHNDSTTTAIHGYVGCILYMEAIMLKIKFAHAFDMLVALRIDYYFHEWRHYTGNCIQYAFCVQNKTICSDFAGQTVCTYSVYCVADILRGSGLMLCILHIIVHFEPNVCGKKQ